MDNELLGIIITMIYEVFKDDIRDDICNSIHPSDVSNAGNDDTMVNKRGKRIY